MCNCQLKLNNLGWKHLEAIICIAWCMADADRREGGGGVRKEVLPPQRRLSCSTDCVREVGITSEHVCHINDTI